MSIKFEETDEGWTVTIQLKVKRWSELLEELRQLLKIFPGDDSGEPS